MLTRSTTSRVYFVTATEVQWIDVFTRSDYADIVIKVCSTVSMKGFAFMDG